MARDGHSDTNMCKKVMLPEAQPKKKSQTKASGRHFIYKNYVCRIRRLNSNLALSWQSNELYANANMLLSCRIGCCYPKIRKSVQRYRDRRESKLFVEFLEYSGHDDTFDETRYQESNHSHNKERKSGNAPSQRVSVTKPGIVYFDYFDDPHPSSDEEGMTLVIS